jgi:hypothetical protein
MFIHAVKRALDEHRSFVLPTNQCSCASLDALFVYIPTLFALVDNVLLNGALQTFFTKKNISLHFVRTSNGPAGVTTYDSVRGMRICLNAHAWAESFPQMVGGNLCSKPDTCLLQTFLHEMVHVILFTIYIELDLNQKQIESIIPTDFDPTHNILFTTWLHRFFHQDTIDNSLLLRSTDVAKPPLHFDRNLHDIEQVCLAKKDLQHQDTMVFYQGVWQEAVINNDQTGMQPHHSRVRTKTGQKLIVPNGLLKC